LLEWIASSFDQKLEDIYGADSRSIVQRGATVPIAYLDIGLAGEDGFGEVEGGDGGGEHEEGLSGGREGGVEGGTHLIDESGCGLRRALVHLHALQPDLRPWRGT
jgi:hypothetical protein